MGERYIWVGGTHKDHDSGVTSVVGTIYDTQQTCKVTGGLQMVAMCDRDKAVLLCKALNGELVEKGAACVPSRERLACRWKTADGITPFVGDRVWFSARANIDCFYYALPGDVGMVTNQGQDDTLPPGNYIYSTRELAQAAIDAKK